MTAVNLQFAQITNADAFADLQMDTISFSGLGDNVIVSGIAKKKIYVYRIWFVVGGATNITFKNGTSTSLSGAAPMTAYGSFALDISNIPWYQTSAGNDFILGSSASVQVSGTVYYRQN